MDRINLNPNSTIAIPVSLNGEDIDLEINTESFAFIAGTEKIKKLLDNVSEKLKTADVEKDIEELDELWQETARTLCNVFCSFCANFKESVGDNIISSMSVWLQLMRAISIQKANADNLNSVVKDIQEEQTESLKG